VSALDAYFGVLAYNIFEQTVSVGGDIWFAANTGNYSDRSLGF
jgi:hypothetical protein